MRLRKLPNFIAANRAMCLVNFVRTLAALRLLARIPRRTGARRVANRSKQRQGHTFGARNYLSDL
jgi:hypothetical protein